MGLVDCDNCDGTGAVEVHEITGWSFATEDVIDATYMVACPDCQGDK